MKLMHVQLLQAGYGKMLNCQAHTFTATTPDCHYSQSPKPVHHTEDIAKTGPTEETASTELAIIFHHPLPVVLNTPLRYPRDGTFPMNFDHSRFACCAPAVEATTTGHDDCEPLLRLTTLPEQESLRGYEGNTKLAF